MGWKIAGAGLGLLLILGACEDGTPEQNIASVRAKNPVSDQLKTTSELYRYLGLRRGIIDNNQPCKRADRGAYQQEYKTMAMWVVHCIDSGDWAVFIAPNGDVQARKCSDAAVLGIPACR